MKTMTLMVAAALVMAVGVPNVHAADPLFEANRLTLIELLGDDYDPKALDSSDPSDVDPPTMEEVVTEAAQMLTDMGIHLDQLLEAEEEADPSSFPIVSSAAGAGLMLELGVWFSGLPIRCNAVHLHQLADLPAGPDELLVSPLSTKTQGNVAAGVDAAGALPQVVVYSDTTVYALGDITNGCTQFELCIFGICLFSFLLHVAVLLTGVITDDVTGLGVLAAAHGVIDGL